MSQNELRGLLLRKRGIKKASKLPEPPFQGHLVFMIVVAGMLMLSWILKS